MRPLVRRRTAIAALVLAALAGASCSVLGRSYEYEEELTLSIDGSATVDVNASIASLVALRGADLDVDPEARPDRARVRALFTAPGVEVGTPTFFRRGGRRFVHVRVAAAHVEQLPRAAPFAWSSYRFLRAGDAMVFQQVVGRPAAGRVAQTPWRGDELVAFRMHLPSRITYENATSDVLRGNILAWEQPLRDRLAGTPVDLHVEMRGESILYSTLLLFGATIAAAGATFVLVIWWIVRRGRAAARHPVEITAPAAPSATGTSARR